MAKKIVFLRKELILLLIVPVAIFLFYNIVVIGNTTTIGKIFYFAILTLSFCLLTFLGYEDLKDKEISASLTYLLVAISVLYNLVLIISQTEFLWDGNYVSGIHNLLMGILAGLFIFLMVKVSKEKAIGVGDIFLFFIMGAFLGFNKFLFGFYITILTATVAALIYAVKKRTIKNIRIPFIPFIYFGIIIGFFVSSNYLLEILEKVFNF